MLSLPSSVPSQPEPHNIRRLPSGLLVGHGTIAVGTGLILRGLFSSYRFCLSGPTNPLACMSLPVTPVSMAGTNNLLPDPVVASESKRDEEVVMKPRIDYAKGAPGTVTAMRGLETYVRKCGLEVLSLNW